MGLEVPFISGILVLLIRYLQSELYAVIVALSIILGGACSRDSFDALYVRTCPPRRKVFERYTDQ